MSMIAIATVAMFAAMTLVLGLMLAATPYLMRRNECFAVTVPTAAQTDPRLVALKKRYVRIMLVITAVLTAASAAGGILIVQGTGDSAAISGATGTGSLGIALECIAVIGLALVSFALMLSFRKRVIAIKRAEGWAAARHERTAVIGEEDLPGPISLAWNLLYLVVLLFTLALGLVLYPSMPDLIPMHSDFAGNVDSYAEKSILVVFGFPLGVEVFLALVFLGCHAVMIHSKQPTDPKAPATSRLAYGFFARVQSIFMLAVGLITNVAIGIGFMLSSAGVASLAQIGVALVVVASFVVIGAVAISVVYGQAGSRLFKRMQGDDFLPDDDDEHWKLGVFYINRDDPSVFLPKRFGIGWTINFARPATWILAGCFLSVDILMIVALTFFA